jgi:LysR family glycine cleavage system transcriptional activator
MSRRRLPPLNALRAFEAAARHLSFEKAGDEIAVTASAVGQQIKTLEAWLGRPLFLRQPAKGVALTPLGERYAAAITETLNRLNEATAQALKPEASNIITVSAMPSLASNWLIPRLGSFQKRHPELDVRVSVSTRLTDFTREDVDVALRFGRGDYPGLRTDLLMEEAFFAVCSAALVNDPERPLREPGDLRHHTLIHEAVEDIPGYVTWDNWFAALGIKGLDTSRGPHYTHTYLCLQAAAAGQGVALATNALIGDHLKAGRLVRPFPHEVKGTYQYYVVCPEEFADRPAIAAFRAWLLDEAQAQAAENTET